MYESIVESEHDSGGITPLKRDQAYLAIRDAIIRLDLPPSSLIDEAALCTHLGLGRTPIREALQRLMYEGLVTVYPRRGAVVTPISAMDAQHLTQARLVWEPNIARLAAQAGTPSAWDELEEVLAGSPSVYTCTADVARGADINGRFHRGIAVATGNPYLVELIDGYLHRRARLSFLFFRHGLYDPVTAQHYDILACLRTGDGDGAAALMEKHILITRDRDARVFM
jgi:DNA-binding GntR family transcriptional regulator